jgi:hypothetical protein
MRRYGDAELDLVLQPGQAVEVFYAAPYNQFTSGSMGFTKQPRKGLALLLVPLAILLVMLVFVLILSLFMS